MRTVIIFLIVVICVNTISLKAQVEMTRNISSTNDDGTLYWVGTAVFSAGNLTTSYFNIKKLNKEDKYRSNAIFGIISGCAQTALGVAFVNANYKNAYIPTGINIGVGLTTVATSILRLAKKNPSKQNSTSFNFMYLPNSSNNTAILGFTFKKEL